VANEVSEKGDLQVAMPVAGPDEVGRLAHSFDAMLGSLRDAQEHLEEQVAQRTEALQRAETRLQAVLDHVVEGIITVDAQGTIESCNHSAEAMLGFTTAQLCGRDLAGLFEQASALAFLAEHAAAAHCDPPLEAPREVNVIRADGVMFPGEIAASEMWVDGRRRFVVMLRDITERQRVDRLKREFVSTVSHELRTPLTSIRGALGLLAGGVAGGLPDEAKAMVDIARKNAERLINLINDILDIEKIESGKMSFAMAEVELMPLVKQALEANHAYGEQFGVCFALRGELLAARVRVDQERLVQVITNLLSNAAKFSPRGAVVEVTATESPPGWARVSVRDQGPGIADAFQDKLFQRFFQADASDSRQKGGTGLGLAISKAIVEHMHGHIGYATESGVGATFYVEFPLVCAAST
jgi:PAS domain S-box-containing protein